MLLIKDEYAKDVISYSQLIMTPNMREMKRLCDKFSIRIDMDDVSYLPIALDELIVKFKGLTTIVLKCNLDYILDNDSVRTIFILT
jgi:NAD(P)H-hydrate repair Nnr-like enzyme with NAD(P)H-hydrate dehydratase domain